MRRIGIFITLVICLIMMSVSCVGQPSSTETPTPISPTTSIPTTTTSSPTSVPIPSPTPTSTPAPTIILAPAPTSAPTTGELKVHFIDVGQGDSILLDLGETEILIDGGGKAPGVVAYVDDYVDDGMLEVVIATHPHADHIGGLIAVLGFFKIGEIWLNGDTETSKTYSQFLSAVNSEGTQVYEARRGNAITIGELNFNVLHPVNLNDTTNNNSIVLSLSYGEIDFLFMGDAEKKAEASMLEAGVIHNVEILKVGHHGSNSSSSPEFIRTVKPEIAIYMAGEGNTYSHPHEETIAILTDVGADIYGTDVHGTIIVTTKGQTHDLQLEKPGPPIEPDSPPPPPPPPPNSVILESIDLGSEIAVITNISGEPVDMTGWRLVSTVGGQQFVFPAFTLQPNASVQVVSGPNAKDNPPNKLLWNRAYNWNNKGDPGELYNSEGKLVSKYP